MNDVVEVWIRCTQCQYQWHCDNCPVGDISCLRCQSPLVEFARQKPDWWTVEPKPPEGFPVVLAGDRLLDADGHLIRELTDDELKRIADPGDRYMTIGHVDFVKF